MKFVDEFRHPEKAKALIAHIHALKDNIPLINDQPLQFMEFCGGHTHTIFRYGIEPLLPDWIELLHGPGCPVCILPMGRIDECITLAEQPNIIFATFGDAMRVPGTSKNLLQARADGADIRMTYSPLDALELARQNPDREVVFFALGFETTMPSTALTVLQADAEGINNFSLFCQHITTPGTLQTLLDLPDMNIDGFLAPGHVSMVIGEQPFNFVAKEYKKPLVITGFEPVDILQSIYQLTKQFAEQRCEVENQYSRVVQKTGNKTALSAISEVFETLDFVELRGLGLLQQSGIKMQSTYAQFDAEKKFSVPHLNITDPSQCQCGDVLKGLIKPWQCKAFGQTCTPENPLGALMVSSEGSCAAYYSFSDVAKLVAKRQRTSLGHTV